MHKFLIHFNRRNRIKIIFQGVLFHRQFDCNGMKEKLFVKEKISRQHNFIIIGLYQQGN